LLLVEIFELGISPQDCLKSGEDVHKNESQEHQFYPKNSAQGMDVCLYFPMRELTVMKRDDIQQSSYHE